MTTEAISDDSEMNELMAKWDKENPMEDTDEVEEEGDDDTDCMGYDDMLEKFRRELTVTENAFDHIVLGASDLDQACDDFEAMTGLRPVMVVSLSGLGTWSARVAFEQCAFLEIVAPDPKQTIKTDLVGKLSKIPKGQLVPVHYAIRNSNSKDLQKSLWTSELNLECDQVTMIAKERGQPWKWDMYFLEEKDAGVNGMLPFFVSWNGVTHAAARLPIVGKLNEVIVKAPSGSPIHKLLTGVNDIDVEEDEHEHFELSFTTPKGKQTFSGSSLLGVSFPK